MRIAVLDANRVVQNIIECADESFAKAQAYPAYVVLAENQWCDVSAVWDGADFSSPVAG